MKLVNISYIINYTFKLIHTRGCPTLPVSDKI